MGAVVYALFYFRVRFFLDQFLGITIVHVLYDGRFRKVLHGNMREKSAIIGNMPMAANSQYKKGILIIAGAVLILGAYFLISNFGRQSENTAGDNNPTNGVPAMPDSPYVSTADWPPEKEVVDQKFTCIKVLQETDRAGGTEEKTINGRVYCVTKVTEGAAGSAYTQYSYAYPTGDKTAILTFSIRFVQCGNYNEPERTACAQEQASFDPDIIADEYASATAI